MRERHRGESFGISAVFRRPSTGNRASNTLTASRRVASDLRNFPSKAVALWNSTGFRRRTPAGHRVETLHRFARRSQVAVDEVDAEIAVVGGIASTPVATLLA